MKYFAALAVIFLIAAPLRAEDLASQVQAELNLARTAPQRYAQIVASHAAGHRHIEGEGVVREAVRFLEKVRPLAPLTRSVGMTAGALSHVLDQGASGARGHQGSDGSSPWKRMARFGQYRGLAGENIAYGQRDARGIVVALIVDDGVRSRGHRKNIFGGGFRCAGIACGPHAGYGSMCVIDLAGGFSEAGADLATTRSSGPLRAF